MKKIVALCAATLTLAAFATAGLAATGEDLFKQHCAACHPDGGNIVNPKETLKGLKDTKMIVKKIRSGGGGMTAFDKKTISDKDAKAIAGYIVKTFKK